MLCKNLVIREHFGTENERKIGTHIQNALLVEIRSYMKDNIIDCLAEGDDILIINFTDKISLRQLSSLWYGGRVAQIMFRGYTFNIEARGDVRGSLIERKTNQEICRVKDKSNNCNFYQVMSQFAKSDKSLYAMLDKEHPKYELDMTDHNWWELFITTPSGEKTDGAVLDSDSLLGAIADVIVYLDDWVDYASGN